MAGNTSHCTGCGQPIEYSARFCARCGTANDPATNRETPLFTCPYCFSHLPPRFKKSLTATTWIVFVVLLVLDFLLSPLAFFIKEEQRVCSGCGIKLGG